jgi:poly(hydroxyalkanoate) depolymerase family esterase
MRSIADTIARLSKLKQHPIGQQALDDDRLEELNGFGSNPGALRARTYVADNLLSGAPLVVVLHGCTQTAASYNHGSGWSSLANQNGFAVLFPEQQRLNNPNLCFNWFLAEDNRRGSGEALSIRQMIERMVMQHGLDRRRIFVTGLSAGGAMAGVMLAAYPDVFAGGAIIAGLPFGCARSIPEAFDRMRGHGGPTGRELGKLVRQASGHSGPWPSISVWHGTADNTVLPSNAQDIVDQWRDVHGLPKPPARTEISGPRHTKRIWVGADGSDVIEENIIAGMGHGTPLEIGCDGLGEAGPYMLDVAVSSTQLIARFWGLATSSKMEEPIRAIENLPVPFVLDLKYDLKSSKKAKQRHGHARAHPHTADGVRKVIEDALKAAGLMT